MFLLAVICFVSLFREYQQCNNWYKKSLDNLDIDKLVNHQWWEYQTFNTFNLGNAYDHECLVTKLYYDADNQLLTVVEDSVKRLPGIVNKEHYRTEWPLKKTKNPGHFSGEILSGDFCKLLCKTDDREKLDVVYCVLDTDYENWLFVEFQAGNKLGAARVMTRSRFPSETQVKDIESKLRARLKENDILPKKRFSYTTKLNDECKPVTFPDRL